MTFLLGRVNQAVTAGCVAAILAAAVPAAAAPLIVNGGFESGFTGWTTADALGGDGTFFIQSGTSSPVTSSAVAAPPEGASAAMTDAGGPGTHVLYQDIFVPLTLSGTVTLTAQLFINNQATQFEAPDTLDFSTPAPNQQARVDIMTTSADPFSVAAGDVLLNVFRTNVGDPLVSGYGVLSVDVTALLQAHLGQTLRLRFAEVDNLFIFNFGVDDVAFETENVPEPTTLALIGVGLAIAGTRRQRS